MPASSAEAIERRNATKRAKWAEYTSLCAHLGIRREPQWARHYAHLKGAHIRKPPTGKEGMLRFTREENERFWRDALGDRDFERWFV